MNFGQLCIQVEHPDERLEQFKGPACNDYEGQPLARPHWPTAAKACYEETHQLCCPFSSSSLPGAAAASSPRAATSSTASASRRYSAREL